MLSRFFASDFLTKIRINFSHAYNASCPSYALELTMYHILILIHYYYYSYFRCLSAGTLAWTTLRSRASNFSHCTVQVRFFCNDFIGGGGLQYPTQIHGVTSAAVFIGPLSAGMKQQFKSQIIFFSILAYNYLPVIQNSLNDIHTRHPKKMDPFPGQMNPLHHFRTQ
jgi:hypothetical protein